MIMWKLKCVNGNEVIAEETVKFTNVIGRDDVRLFFARNQMALSDFERELVFGMNNGDSLKFTFPNNIKYIEVECF
jgi:hypothetical protein